MGAHLLSRRHLLAGVLALSACGKSGSTTGPSREDRSSPDARFVAPNGSDSNDGTAGHPWRTLAMAAQSVRSRMTVFVAAGDYAGAVRTSVSSVQYVGEGARVHAASEFVWHNTGSQVMIDGFEIFGDSARTRIGILNEGSSTTVTGCRVHDIAAVGSGANGGAGIDQVALDCQTLSCTVWNIGTGSTESVHGIYQARRGGRVSGNTIRNIEAWGVHLYPMAGDVQVTNNEISGCRFGGIIVNGHGATADGVVVTDNRISSCPQGIEERGATGSRNRYERNLPMTGVRTPYSLQNGRQGT
jgi:parallel beta helix pectate lyase-like protein/uncharacterized protein DUF1565